MKRSSEAKRVLDELDAELASNVARAGRSLGWSAAERQILAMVADSIDRAVELTAAYRQAGDVKDKLKLSRELRLQEATTESCTSVCWCTGGTAGSAHGVVSSHELGSTAIAARACFAKGAISHFHYGAPGCSDIVE